MTELIPIVLAIVLVSVPIIALIGGIVAGILHRRGRQRLHELAYRERIAALERGIDPATLPPVVPPEAWEVGNDDRMAPWPAGRWLFIGGVLLVAFGLGIGVVMALIEPGQGKWIVGIIPTLTGGALLVCDRLLRGKR